MRELLGLPGEDALKAAPVDEAENAGPRLGARTGASACSRRSRGWRRCPRACGRRRRRPRRARRLPRSSGCGRCPLRASQPRTRRLPPAARRRRARTNSLCPCPSSPATPDLAAMKREVHRLGAVPQDEVLGSRTTGAVNTATSADRLSALVAAWPVIIDRRLRSVISDFSEHADVAAIAHHGRPVADPDQFGDAVGDDQHRRAPITELAHAPRTAARWNRSRARPRIRRGSGPWG